MFNPITITTRQRLPEHRHILLRIIVPVIVFMLVVWIRITFLQFLGSSSPFVLFSFVIMFATWYAGALSGVFICIVSILFTDYLYLPPINDIVEHSSTQLTQLILFFAQSLGIIFITMLMQHMLRNASVETKERIKNEMYYRALLEQASEAIVLIGQDDMVIDVNQTAQKMLSPFLPTIIGKNFFTEIITLLEKKPNEKRDSSQTSHYFEATVVNENHIATVMHIQGSYRNIVDDHALVLFRDITQKREFEQKQLHFIDIISHEIRTPLTVLKSYLQLLHQQEKKSSDKMYTLKSLAATRRLEVLISNITDVVLLQHASPIFHMSAFSLNDLIQETIQAFQITQPNRLVKSQLDKDIVIVADRDRLSQAIMNLLTNGVKYSADDTTVFIRTLVSASTVKIDIQDMGIGIPKQEHKQIFQKFFKSSITPEHISGVGMGLFIVKQIVDKHKGTIEIESEEGRGSTFSISLPLMPQLVS